MNKAYNYLWTGESVFCVCTHHIEEHTNVKTLENLFSELKNKKYKCGKCKHCKEFITYKTKPTLSSKLGL